MVVIVWQLDLQLPVQSLPISITTKNCEFKPSSWRGSLDTTLPYVIKFVSDLRQVCSFIRVLCFPPQKNDCNEITEILLKVALHTIN